MHNVNSRSVTHKQFKQIVNIARLRLKLKQENNGKLKCTDWNLKPIDNGNNNNDKGERRQ